MARTDTLGNFLTDVCDAVREKTGETGTIKASELDTKIQNISSSDITAVFYSTDEGLTPASENSGVKITINTEEIPDFGLAYNSSSYRYGDYWIKLVHIGNKVKKIGKRAFYDGPSFTFADDNTVTEIGEYAFFRSHRKNDPETINLPFTTTIGKNCFYGCASKNINMPQLTSIPESAFYGCTNLETFDFTNITTIGASAFNKCSSLKKIVLDGCDISSSKQFSTCTSLVSACINDARIGHAGLAVNAPFYDCTSLRAAWVHPTALTKTYGFGTMTFCNCLSLKYIYVDYPRAQVEAADGYSTLWGCSDVVTDCQIICNDDANWITREQFNSIDWATYGGETTE